MAYEPERDRKHPEKFNPLKKTKTLYSKNDDTSDPTSLASREEAAALRRIGVRMLLPSVYERGIAKATVRNEPAEAAKKATEAARIVLPSVYERGITKATARNEPAEAVKKATEAARIVLPSVYERGITKATARNEQAEVANTTTAAYKPYILPSLYNNSTYISDEELAARAADAKRTTETKNFAQKRYEFRTVIDHMYTKAAEQTQQKPKGVAESAKNKAYEHDWEKKMRVLSISKGMNSASSEESEEEFAPSEESEEKKKDTGSTTLNAIKSVVALAVLAILAAKYNKMRSGRRGGDGLPKVSRKKR